ncbi:aldo/keto reductase [Hoyosella altamirensis]|uniref:Putative oxidoreductase n=1 Tax=Hoyosella altamirensis TaxID=616997 RepID=A0A839RV76_9ACTN|nr:aldo/keto reductase [Hoyosella altamirensis]MBB3039691.1 putative oxidoreductase [Hoyosella altamirensis]
MSAQAGEARLLYGCMGLGGDWNAEDYGSAEIAHAEAAVEAALEIGITTFDHADIYRRGKSEAVFGELLGRNPSLRGQIDLQTKCGIRLADAHRAGMYDLRGNHIRTSVEKSMTRLRTDVIDTLLLHRPDPLADPDEIAETLMSLHSQGMVRQFGVSNMDAPQIALLQSRLELPLVVNQLEMSLHRRDWLELGVLVNTTHATEVGFPNGTLEHCRMHGIRLQAWASLAQGKYSGLQGTTAEHETAQLVEKLAESKGTTPETILLWWLQRHPARIEPVVGSARPDRIRSCRDAVGRAPELSHEEWYELWITARGAPLP